MASAAIVQRFGWPKWFVAFGICTATALVTTSSYFSIVTYLVTLVMFLPIFLALRHRPIGATKQVIYFQIFMLTLLYPLKGMYIAWSLDVGAYENLPSNLDSDVSVEVFSAAYITSAMVISALSALFFVVSDNALGNHDRLFQKREDLYPNVGKIIVAVLGFFVASFVLRLTPISGLVGSIIYVLNHRSAHFLFALLVFFLCSQKNVRLAQWSILVWLALGCVQFLAFASKFYIFAPIITLLILYILTGVTVFSRFVIILFLTLAVAGYPMFNLYRAVTFGGVSDISELSFSISLLSELRSDQPLWEVLPIYFSQMIGRFIGIEWYMTVIEAFELEYFTNSSGLLGNMMSIQETMLNIVGRTGQALGVAPSFFGACLLISRDIILTPAVGLSFCLMLVVLLKGFAFIFRRVRDFLIAPFALIVFSILGDGLVTSLYWDVPALMVSCAFFSTLLGRQHAMAHSKYA